MRIYTAILGILLACFPAFSQTPGILQIKVLDGDGAINNIRNKTGQVVAVEVRDENSRPVRGAEVTFTTPAVGPGGTYANGSRTMTAVTDADGIAQSEALKPNPAEGRFTITVRARQGTREGVAAANQTNTMAAVTGSSSHKKLWIILGAVGGGAVAGLALRGGGSNAASTNPVTVITVGGVSVGAPR